MPQYFIYTDASFSHLHTFGVSGFIIFDSVASHEQSKIAEPGIRTHFFKESNNIRAEIVGAILALKTFSEEFKNIKQNPSVNPDNIEINLYSDCQTLTKLLLRRQKLVGTDYMSARKKKPLTNADLYKEFFIIYDELQPAIHWVKGHTKKENQTSVQKNFQLVDKQVRKELRVHVQKLK